MRYQNLRAFQKHLSSAAPDHLCKCYLIAVADDYERKAAIQAILAHFPGRPCVRLNGADAPLVKIIDSLLSPTLFGGEPVVLLEEAQDLEKQELQGLIRCCSSAFYGYLLCATRSKTPLSAAIEKAGVVLDSLEEKPWEKEKRLEEHIAQRAQNGGKWLAPDAAALLFERLGADASLLDSEMDKLICFVGKRPTIERSDVFCISSFSRSSTIWATAEEIVWERQKATLGSNPFQGLVPAIRSQLQTGLKITELAAQNTPREKWGSYFPKLWPRLLEKRITQAAKLGRLYFQNGLDLLFQVECHSRIGASREGPLLDYFQISLHSIQCSHLRN
ncbi:MAG TPA: hypothetical protein VLE95_04665 [Chlamydiales bacterium]|nr:hypothetical protein [Chlamydiales bacterium]